MSKLEELIQQYCPDGVEYVKLGDVAQVCRGVRVVKSQLSKLGYPVYQNCLTPMGYYDKTNCPQGTTFVICGGAAGNVGYTDVDCWAADDCEYIQCDNSKVINKYIYYCLVSNQHYLLSQVRKASIPRLSPSVIKDLVIPVPPLPVQEEIVKILDAFASYTAELEAELEARKKQYEYYRDNLLSFNKLNRGGQIEVEWKKLGDVADLLSGFPFDSTQFTKTGIKLMRGINIKRGQLCFNDTDDRFWNSVDGLEKYIINENDIVISMDGSLVGKSFGMVKKEDLPLLLVQRVARIRSSVVNINFIYHCITNWFPNYVDKKKTPGAIPHISMKDIANFMLPIPSETEQEKIVSLLDRFDTITNDLTSGLPAEIEKRRQQYEYYRDKLLTFKRKES
ncbi:MAG: restriction endonuclease subunit S [Bacteroidales bacterium]|nr:restriction endonuclease subunit S [Bacteroidales bacterium]